MTKLEKEPSSLVSLTYEGRTVSKGTKIFNQGINQMRIEQ